MLFWDALFCWQQILPMLLRNRNILQLRRSIRSVSLLFLHGKDIVSQEGYVLYWNKATCWLQQKLPFAVFCGYYSLLYPIKVLLHCLLKRVYNGIGVLNLCCTNCRQPIRKVSPEQIHLLYTTLLWGTSWTGCKSSLLLGIDCFQAVLH